MLDWFGVGSPIWNLLKVSMPLILNHISYSSGNDTSFNIWKYKIEGFEELSQNIELKAIQRWHEGSRIATLFEISNWGKGLEIG